MFNFKMLASSCFIHNKSDQYGRMCCFKLLPSCKTDFYLFFACSEITFLHAHKLFVTCGSHSLLIVYPSSGKGLATKLCCSSLQSGQFVSGDVNKQADQCLKNLGAVLTKAGGTYENSNSILNYCLSKLWLLSSLDL